MYRNVFRGGHANGLEVCKKADIIEKKEHNRRKQEMEGNADVEKMKKSDMQKAQHIRNSTNPMHPVTEKY